MTVPAASTTAWSLDPRRFPLSVVRALWVPLVTLVVLAMTAHTGRAF